MPKTKLQRFFDNQKSSVVSVLGSLVAIVFGLLIGIILIVAFDADSAPDGIRALLITGLTSLPKLADVLYQTAPLLLCGLAVGFAFKTGLFNIGASGQYTVGAVLALFGGLVLHLNWFFCLLLAAAGGAAWGFFPGFFKARFNVHEVISSIMFNWIALFLVNVCVANTPAMLGQPASRTANLAAVNSGAVLPDLGLKAVFGSNYINIGVLIAVIVAIIAHIVLNKTTFGYEMKACGKNRNASLYAGINAKRQIILSMVLSGSMAGIAGGVYYLSGNANYVIETHLLQMGFDGIAVALLGANSPLGIIFSALFIAYVYVGGNAMQPEYATETIDIILAAIIYLSAFAFILRGWIGRKLGFNQPLKLDDPPPETAQAATDGESEVSKA